jgi:hypothetical protein
MARLTKKELTKNQLFFFAAYPHKMLITLTYSAQYSRALGVGFSYIWKSPLKGVIKTENYE